MDDCQSFSSKPKWMERECLMCLMARRDIEIERCMDGRQEQEQTFELLKEDGYLWTGH